MGKLLEMYAGGDEMPGGGNPDGSISEDIGELLDKPDHYEPPILASV